MGYTGRPLRATRLLVRGEARALLDGVHELAEAVAQLEPRHVELEALGQAWVVRLPAGERRLRRRVVDEEHGAGRGARARARPGRRARGSSGLRRTRPPPASLRATSRRSARRRRRPRGARRAAVTSTTRSPSRTAPPVTAGDELLGVAHHVLDARARAVPLQHRELGVVTSADLAPTKARRDLVDARQPLGEEALHLVLRRRAQPPGPAPVASRHFERIEVKVEPGRRHDDGRLHLQEAARVEEGAHLGADAGSLAQPLHGRAGRITVRPAA